MAKNTRTYSDLDFNFIPHPVTGDVGVKYDADAIKASVKNLVLTMFYERPFHSEIGSQIKGLLFEPYSPFTDAMIKSAVKQTILNFEPRVELTDVLVNSAPDNNEIYITIQFKIVNTVSPIILDLVLQRTR